MVLHASERALKHGLNESPSEKEGKSKGQPSFCAKFSMSLNESPSEKEGKCKLLDAHHAGAMRPQ